jgi:hypothetical protein
MLSSLSPVRPGRPTKPEACRLIHTGMRLGWKDRQRLHALARSEGISMSEYMRRLVWAHLAAKAA